MNASIVPSAIGARLGHAVAKASVMRFLGVPRLPLPHPVSAAFLARNRPGPADSLLSSRSPHLYFLPLFTPVPFSPLLFRVPCPCPSVLCCSPFFSSLSVIGLRSSFVMNLDPQVFRLIILDSLDSRWKVEASLDSIMTESVSKLNVNIRRQACSSQY